MTKTVLYIGGFELPDKNAAAHRVIGIARGLRELGYEVVFLNSLKIYDKCGVQEKTYFDFKCYEYKRESEIDYLFSARNALLMIKKIKPDLIIAYNYPAVALNNIRKYCKNNSIKCYADATEWYQAVGGNVLYRLVKNWDTAYRMKYIQKKLDGVISISRFLYDYYKDTVKTVIIPPTVDLSDEKWNLESNRDDKHISFVYAGVPIALKEKLDTIVKAFETAHLSKRFILNIVGVTEQQFRKMYGWDTTISKSIKFWGRIDHKKVIEIVKTSDWAIILRDNNRVVKAGFPTKLVEAISCGTPVIINEFSNVSDYIGQDNGIIVENYQELVDAITVSCDRISNIDRTLFDYHCYLDELRNLIDD